MGTVPTDTGVVRGIDHDASVGVFLPRETGRRAIGAEIELDTGQQGRVGGERVGDDRCPDLGANLRGRVEQQQVRLARCAAPRRDQRMTNADEPFAFIEVSQNRQNERSVDLRSQ
jgi:hypothetical protein